MTRYDYDLFVIGAGSGGVRASRMAAQHGAKVAVAEEYRPGGTCVIRGCIPKKLLSYASHFADDFEDAASYGWTVGERSFSWSTLIANKDKEIARLSGIYSRLMHNAGAETFDSRAVLEDAHTIRLVSQDRTITAENILIATGARPHVPNNVPGIEHAVSSNEMFELAELPKRAVIVGAGYIAVEFASILNGLGSDVTIVYRGAEILRGFDLDVRALLREEMAAKGIRIRVETDVESIEPCPGGRLITFKDFDEIETDLILYATGRVPNTEGLGLDKARIELDRTGAIKVDAYSRTNVPNIFAVGDVTNRMQLTPVALREGAAVVETLFNNRPTALDYDNVPTAVFSNPPIGVVGLTEEEAFARFRKVDVYKTTFRPLKHTLTGRNERVLFKLLVDAETDRVLGCHMVGQDAPELVQLAGVAIKMGATKADFDATVAVHPTAAEELVTLREKAMPAEVTKAAE